MYLQKKLNPLYWERRQEGLGGHTRCPLHPLPLTLEPGRCAPSASRLPESASNQTPFLEKQVSCSLLLLRPLESTPRLPGDHCTHTVFQNCHQLPFAPSFTSSCGLPTIGGRHRGPTWLLPQQPTNPAPALPPPRAERRARIK